MTERTPSALDAACDAFVYDVAAHTPTSATSLGIPGYDGELEDFSPAFHDDAAARIRSLLARVDELEAEGFDDVDRVTAAVLRDRLGLDLAAHDAGEHLRDLNNIASPVQTIRDTLSLMPTDTPEQLDNIASRVSKIRAALDGYRATLIAGRAAGTVPAARQVAEVASQCAQLADGSLLDGLGLPQDSAAAQAAVADARAAFGEFGQWLKRDLLPHAPEADAFGRERYELWSQIFVGAKVDLDEAYEWGLERVRDITAEQEAIAAQLYGAGTTPEQAMERLNEEERYTLHGRDALVAWMQETADGVIASLNGTYFDIAEPVQRIECLIDPAGSGGIFYTGPSDDFTRPGRMWWSVPEGQDVFHTWQELTTVHHEGAPGHHLQIGAAMTQRELNFYRRAACWNSGHGEGWALYSEAFMAELGFMDDPGFRMGLLDSQRFRAARVAADIGLHLGKAHPTSGAAWTGQDVHDFMRANTAMDDANLTFEVNRYLGWAGQAPSYALGERLWQQTRDAAVARGMTVRDFHSRALALGSIPMSILAEAVLGQE